MHNATLLASQNEQLLAENRRQKRKRAQRRSYIARQGVLTGNKAQTLIENGESSRTGATGEASSEIRQRALPKCSLCSSLAHNARICPDRQRIIS